MTTFPLETRGPAVVEVTPGSGESGGVSPKCCWGVSFHLLSYLHGNFSENLRDPIVS